MNKKLIGTVITFYLLSISPAQCSTALHILEIIDGRLEIMKKAENITTLNNELESIKSELSLYFKDIYLEKTKKITEEKAIASYKKHGKKLFQKLESDFKELLDTYERLVSKFISKKHVEKKDIEEIYSSWKNVKKAHGKMKRPLSLLPKEQRRFIELTKKIENKETVLVTNLKSSDDKLFVQVLEVLDFPILEMKYAMTLNKLDKILSEASAKAKKITIKNMAEKKRIQDLASVLIEQIYLTRKNKLFEERNHAMDSVGRNISAIMDDFHDESEKIKEQIRQEMKGEIRYEIKKDMTEALRKNLAEKYIKKIKTISKKIQQKTMRILGTDKKNEDKLSKLITEIKEIEEFIIGSIECHTSEEHKCNEI